MQENRKRLFAISDLHLPGGKDKYMDIFGAQWEGHFDKIKVDWVSRVEDDDIVLIPGDISWAMTLEGAVEDLLSIGELPVTRYCLEGIMIIGGPLYLSCEVCFRKKCMQYRMMRY